MGAWRRDQYDEADNGRNDRDAIAQGALASAIRDIANDDGNDGTSCVGWDAEKLGDGARLSHVLDNGGQEQAKGI